MPPVRAGRYTLNASRSLRARDNSGRLKVVVLDEHDDNGDLTGHLEQSFEPPIPVADVLRLIAGLNSGRIQRWDLA